MVLAGQFCRRIPLTLTQYVFDTDTTDTRPISSPSPVPPGPALPRLPSFRPDRSNIRHTAEDRLAERIFLSRTASD